MGIFFEKIIGFIASIGENIVARDMVWESLKTMGIGMGGVFLVLMVFYLVVKGLLRVFPEKTEQE